MNYDELLQQIDQTRAAVVAAKEGRKWEYFNSGAWTKVPFGYKPEHYIRQGYYLRPAPFDLTSHLALSGFVLSPGQQWHREDWTEEMLPPGWRPLLIQEQPEEGDEQRYIEKTWIKQSFKARMLKADNSQTHQRTQRPLPSVSRPWSKPEDVPTECWLRRKSDPDCAYKIVGVHPGGFRASCGWIWSRVEQLEYSLDRRTWHPCTVEDGK